MLASRLLAWAGGLALTVTGACTTVVAQEPPGGGGGPVDGASGGDASGSGSSGGGSSSGSSGGGADAGACLPGDVTTYTPQYRPAAGAYQGACSNEQIERFFDACLNSGANAAACNAFTSADDAGTAACAACILTPDSSAKYGPLIGHGSFVTANVAGCIELTDPTGSALACAKAVQAQGGCELLACEANCDVHDGSSLNAYESCASTADQAGCSAYASASVCVQGLQEAGDGVAQCLVPDFATFYGVAARLFCGSAPAVDAAPPWDAGSPAPDGSTAGD